MINKFPYFKPPWQIGSVLLWTCLCLWDLGFWPLLGAGVSRSSCLLKAVEEKRSKMHENHFEAAAEPLNDRSK